MSVFKPPRSWQKLVPNTIESWLVSDDPNDQRLADEALAQLAPEAASNYLKHLLVSERDAIFRRLGIVRNVLLCLFVIVAVTALFLKEPLLIPLYSGAASIMTFIITHFRQTATLLQDKVVRQAIATGDVRFIGVLFHSLMFVSNIPLNTAVREHLPGFMNQISTHNRTLVPEEFWKHSSELLDEIAVRKEIKLIPTEQLFALAHVRMCGNARYEPALPALRTLATRTATTPQARELKELAARYVAQWDAPSANRVGTLAIEPDTPATPLYLTVG